MYSKKKDDVSYIQRNPLSLILLIVLLILSIEAITYTTIENEIQCGNFTGNEPEIQKEYKTERYLTSSAQKKNYNVNSSKNSIEKIVSNINVQGFAITIDDKLFGYVLSEKQKDDIVKDLCEVYFKELDINVNDVSNITLNGKIEATPYEMKISELSSSKEISQDIYEAAVLSKNILDLNMNLNNTIIEVIQPPVIVKSDDSIYMGEENIVEGESGLKKVYQELYYDGVTMVDEKIIAEEILVEPVATVVYKGTKNPYHDGIRFLGRPLIAGYISSYFGEIRGEAYHKGLDIAEESGEAIVAAFDGEVIFSGYNDGGYGNLVIIKHSEDMETYYAHMNDIYISNGDTVKEGDIIGTVGSTGYSTGPHLHFELRVDDRPVNPLNYIE